MCQQNSANQPPLSPPPLRLPPQILHRATRWRLLNELPPAGLLCAVPPLPFPRLSGASSGDGRRRRASPPLPSPSSASQWPSRQGHVTRRGPISAAARSRGEGGPPDVAPLWPPLEKKREERRGKGGGRHTEGGGGEIIRGERAGGYRPPRSPERRHGGDPLRGRLGTAEGRSGCLGWAAAARSTAEGGGEDGGARDCPRGAPPPSPPQPPLRRRKEKGRGGEGRRRRGGGGRRRRPLRR